MDAPFEVRTYLIAGISNTSGGRAENGLPVAITIFTPFAAACCNAFLFL